MLSSVYIHVVLIVSCVIFSFSFIVFIQRLHTPHYRHKSNRQSIISNYEKQYTISSTRINQFWNTSDAQINENILREKVLGSDKASQSILHRFSFINPPKLVCNYPQDTQNFLIIIVLSRGLNFDYRQAIRGTWGRSGPYDEYNIHVKTIFFVGTDDTVQLAIRDEQAMFNDVIEIGKRSSR